MERKRPWSCIVATAAMQLARQAARNSDLTSRGSFGSQRGADGRSMACSKSARVFSQAALSGERARSASRARSIALSTRCHSDDARGFSPASASSHAVSRSLIRVLAPARSPLSTNALASTTIARKPERSPSGNSQPAGIAGAEDVPVAPRSGHDRFRSRRQTSPPTAMTRRATIARSNRCITDRRGRVRVPRVPEPGADIGERETPRPRPCERVDLELELRHACDARRQRDEGPNDRQQAGDEHGDAAEPPEEAVGSVEIVRIEQDIAAPALHGGAAARGTDGIGQRRADVAADRPRRGRKPEAKPAS